MLIKQAMKMMFQKNIQRLFPPNKASSDILLSKLKESFAEILIKLRYVL